MIIKIPYIDAAPKSNFGPRNEESTNKKRQKQKTNRIESLRNLIFQFNNELPSLRGVCCLGAWQAHFEVLIKIMKIKWDAG